MPRYCVAIPCYNCARHIEEVLGGFSEPLLKSIERVMVIDNRSEDATVSVALRVQREMGMKNGEVWRNVQNLGLGGTFKVAFRMAQEAGFDYLIILHGDGQAVTQELGRLIQESRNHPDAAAILGARFARGSKRQNYSLVRTLGNYSFNFLFTMLSGQVVSDIGSGLNLYNLKKIPLELVMGLPNHAAFDADLLLHMLGKHLQIRFVPISWREDGQVSTVRNLEVGFDVLKTLVRWRLGQLPIYPTTVELLSERITS